MKRFDPRLTPDDLRARAFRYLVKARQNAERAEAFFRAADRRERQRDDKVTATWPWPCEKCGAAYATEEQLVRHRRGELVPRCPGQVQS
jgi:hypothetical protein